MPTRKDRTGVLVIGMGRFGSEVATTLTDLEIDVLAVEHDAARVEAMADQVAMVEADATSLEALKQLGAEDFPNAVVAIGSSLEASVLVTANLSTLGIRQIWAKAVSKEHSTILKRIGAHHVVLPETQAGHQLAHRLSEGFLDYFEVEENFSIVKMHPPRETQGFTLAESKVRERYGVTVIGVQPPGHDFVYAEPATRISANDIIIVAGHTTRLDRFASRP